MTYHQMIRNLPLKLRIGLYWTRLVNPFKSLWMYRHVGKRVRLSDAHIKNWEFSHENFACFHNGINDDYNSQEYDRLIILSMLMLMREPVWGYVKGIGCDCLLVYFTAAGCSYWGYVDVKDLVFLD